jgi:hypothetical protein
MKKIAIGCIILFAAELFAAVPPAASKAGQQKIENDYFKINAGENGIVSLKRTKDAYDTDYILNQNSIGDCVISYRFAGEEEYRQIKKAKLKNAAGNSAVYGITVEQPSFISRVRASASQSSRTISALNDGAYIENSGGRQNGFFSWSPKKGTKEWVQYDFPAEVLVSAVEVYWFDDHSISGPYRAPQSWRLLYKDDDEWKEVANPSGYGVSLDKFVKVTFEPVRTSAVRIEVQLYEGFSGGILEWRVENDEDARIKAEAAKQAREVAGQIEADSTFELKGDTLFWKIDIKNLTDKPMELGDVGLPLRFNTQYVWDKNITYTQRLIKHFLIAGSGSFIFWMRPNTEPPYLLMTPADKTWLEYFDSETERGRSFCVFIHSKAKAADRMKRGGNWRQANTSETLSPKGKKGDSASYTFKLGWANGFNGVRDLLYERGKIDVHVVPGMTVPDDLDALISLRTKNGIKSVVPEYPAQTKIEYAGEKGKGNHIYKVNFSKLGENILTINYGDGQRMVLEFFVTEPLETVIKKRAAFLVHRQQHKDPNKWYNGVYSDWDMKNHILRSADDRDGLQTWLTDACDDAGNARPAYVASKNVFFPDPKDIESVDYYIKHYLWGGMQQTESEPYPYGIYGIPNWKVNRDSNDPGRDGKKHLWRIYDYPHIVLLYYRMYQVAKFYPEIKTELTKEEYLNRSFRTAIAYFTVPMAIEKWSAYETPTMNEPVISELIAALDSEGKSKEADELRSHWEKKVKYFVNDDPYLFGSEFAFDSTGFEATGALAKYAMENLDRKPFASDVNAVSAAKFMEKQVKLNIADRGWLETAYYYLGTDYRAQGGTGYTLSYMSQMGGWSIVDYALYYAKDPYQYLRLGYASYLSAWALVNSGTPATNYGYWYPGAENDGGAGGGFEPAAYARGWIGKANARGSWYYSAEEDVGFNGALRASVTVAADDPLFGLIAYGGLLKKTSGGIEVIPKDGLRQQFHFIKSNLSIHILLERDGFAADKPVFVSNAGDEIRFDLENRSKSAAGAPEKSTHMTQLKVSGLPAGNFLVKVNGKTVAERQSQKGQHIPMFVGIDVPAGSSRLQIEIARK